MVVPAAPPLLVQLSSLSDSVLLSPQDSLYVFRPYHFSFVVYPSVLDDLPPLVAVALSSCCPDLLRVFNYIVRVSKTAAYLLRGEVYVDFSGSNIDDGFDTIEERSSKNDGWIVLVFSYVIDLKIIWS